MKRVIKRPAAHLGRHAPTLSLLPLFCAALLILCLSACGLGVNPPSNNGVSGTNNGATTETGNGGGDTGSSKSGDTLKGTVNNGETPAEGSGATSEVSAPVLTRDKLDKVDRDALDALAKQVSKVSDDLAVFESKIDATWGSPKLADVLSDADKWLDNLQTKTDNLLSTIERLYSNGRAPGLQEMSKRLAEMLQVIHHNQTDTPDEGDTPLPKFKASSEAVAKLRVWLEELTRRAETLPDMLPEDYEKQAETNDGDTPAPEPPDNPVVNENEALKNLEKTVGVLSGTLDGVSKKLNDVSTAVTQTWEKVNATPTETPGSSLDFFGIIQGFVTAVNLALLIFLLIAVRALATQAQEDKLTDEEIDKIADKVVEKQGKGSALPENRTENDRTEEGAPAEEETPSYTFTQSSPLQPTESSHSEPPPKLEYFTVINPGVADGQPIYLKKKNISGGDIRGTLVSANPQVYKIFPAMSSVTDNGKRGVVRKNVLTSGEIKKCFDVPKQLSAGDSFNVTVESVATIKLATDNQYQLTNRGRLSVS